MTRSVYRNTRGEMPPRYIQAHSHRVFAETVGDFTNAVGGDAVPPKCKVRQDALRVAQQSPSSESARVSDAIVHKSQLLNVKTRLCVSVRRGGVPRGGSVCVCVCVCVCGERERERERERESHLFECG